MSKEQAQAQEQKQINENELIKRLLKLERAVNDLDYRIRNVEFDIRDLQR